MGLRKGSVPKSIYGHLNLVTLVEARTQHLHRRIR